MKYFENLNKIDPKLTSSLRTIENFTCSQMIICCSLQDIGNLINLIVDNANFVESESPKCVTYAKKFNNFNFFFYFNLI